MKKNRGLSRISGITEINKLKNKAVPSELGHHSALLSTSDSEVIAESYS